MPERSQEPGWRDHPCYSPISGGNVTSVRCIICTRHPFVLGGWHYIPTDSGATQSRKTAVTAVSLGWQESWLIPQKEKKSFCHATIIRQSICAGSAGQGRGGLWRREGPRGAMTAMLIPERDLYSHRLDTHHSQKSKGGWTEGTGGWRRRCLGFNMRTPPV